MITNMRYLSSLSQGEEIRTTFIIMNRIIIMLDRMLILMDRMIIIMDSKIIMYRIIFRRKQHSNRLKKAQRYTIIQNKLESTRKRLIGDLLYCKLAC